MVSLPVLKFLCFLGCGLGLTGLVAARLSTNPSGVVLTDGDKNIMDAIQLNIDNNFEDQHHRPKCDVLFWGGPEEVKPFVDKHGRFDLVLGADVLYTESSLAPLIHTVCAVMADSVHAKFLIAFQPKYGGKYRDIVIALARSCDLVPSRVDWMTSRKTRLLDCVEEDDCNVELWQFVRAFVSI